MSYCKDLYRFGQLKNCVGGIIGNLYSEYFFNDDLIQRHLQMKIFSQYDRETIARELFKQRMEMLVASSKSQLDTIQELVWNVTRQKSYKNSSQSRDQPVQRTIKKRNRRQKCSKPFHPYKATENNNLVKCVDFNTKLNPPTTKNNAVSKVSERILSDDYMFDELEQHL